MKNWFGVFVALAVSCVSFARNDRLSCGDTCSRQQQMTELQQYVTEKVQQPTDLSQKQSLLQIIAQGASELGVTAVTQNESNQITVGVILPQIMQGNMSPYWTSIMQRSGYDFSQLISTARVVNDDDSDVSTILQAISRMSSENIRYFLLTSLDYFNSFTDEKDNMAVANLALDHLKDPADLLRFYYNDSAQWPRDNVEILSRLLATLTKGSPSLSKEMTCNFLSSLDLFGMDDEGTRALKTALQITPGATKQITLMMQQTSSAQCQALHGGALTEFENFFKGITTNTVSPPVVMNPAGNQCSYAEYQAKLPELLRPYVAGSMLLTSYVDSLGCRVNIMITPLAHSKVSIRVDANTSKSSVKKIFPSTEGYNAKAVLQAFGLQF